MRIGLYLGSGLCGTDGGAHAHQLSRALATLGHDVQLLCREPAPERIEHVSQAWRWSSEGEPTSLFERRPDTDGSCLLHQLPDTEADALRGVVAAVLRRHTVDVLQVYGLGDEAEIATSACAECTPLVVFWQGGAVVDGDQPSAPLREALLAAAALIAADADGRDRLLTVFADDEPQLLAKSAIVGPGIDTTRFAPQQKAERERRLHRVAARAPAHGKAAALSAELRMRLSNQEWDAVSDYRRAYDPDLPDAEVAARLKAVQPHHRLLLFHGELTAAHGLQSLIAAMPALLDAVPDARLLIAGKGVYREILEALVHAIASRDEALLDALIECGFDLDLEHGANHGRWPDVRAYLDTAAGRSVLLQQGESFAQQVSFLGHLDDDLMRDVLPCADLVVMPAATPQAADPQALLAALASGVLPVATGFPNIAELMAELTPLIGSTWTTRMRLPTAARRVGVIARHLTELLSDPGLGSLRGTLRHVAVDCYDWQVRAAEFAQAFAGAGLAPA